MLMQFSVLEDHGRKHPLVASNRTLKHDEIVMLVAATAHDGKTCGRSLPRSRSSGSSTHNTTSSSG